MARFPACVRKLREKIKRDRRRSPNFDQHTPNSDSSNGSSPAVSSEEQTIDAESRTPDHSDSIAELSQREHDRSAGVIVPSRELLEKVHTALHGHRKLRAAEEAFDDHEWELVRELELTRAEGRRLVADQRGSDHLARLDELERRDDEIVGSVEARRTELVDMWLGIRESLGDILEELMDVFVDAGLLLPQTKEFERKDSAKPAGGRLEPKKEPTDSPLATGRLPARRISIESRRTASTSQSDRESARPHSGVTRKSKTLPNLREEVQRLEDELDQRRQYEQRLLQDYVRARADVREAQRQFELVEVRHDDEERRFCARLEAGEDVGSPLEFDLRLLLDKQRLTRNLIEAEEDCEVAKTQAVKEGIDLGDDERSSGFVSLVSDGYVESEEAGPEAKADVEGFVDWLKKVAESSGDSMSRESPQMDDWEARSVEVWDSVSCHAPGSERRRIDRWQERHCEDRGHGASG